LLKRLWHKIIKRLGTISPWSSKASDILHLCGLEKVKRIERGIIYHFEGEIIDKKAVLSIIMDKMTESELVSIDTAHSIFDDFVPQPFKQVDILAEGKLALEQANSTLGVALSAGEVEGAMAVGWLCVSTFIKIALCSDKLT
jgi:phosphoribosylformylglycinamidine synthase